MAGDGSDGRSDRRYTVLKYRQGFHCNNRGNKADDDDLIDALASGDRNAAAPPQV